SHDHIESGDFYAENAGRGAGDRGVARVGAVGKVDAVASGADVGVLAQINGDAVRGNGVEIEALRAQVNPFRFVEADFFERGDVAFSPERVLILPFDEIADR